MLELVRGDPLQSLTQYRDPAVLDRLAIKQHHGPGRYSVDVHSDNAHDLLFSPTRLRVLAAITTLTRPRSQRIRSSRRGGQTAASTARLIALRRAVRPLHVPVPMHKTAERSGSDQSGIGARHASCRIMPCCDRCCLRDECLNAYWFRPLADGPARIEAWRWRYIESRPHTSLG